MWIIFNTEKILLSVHVSTSILNLWAFFARESYTCYLSMQNIWHRSIQVYRGWQRNLQCVQDTRTQHGRFAAYKEAKKVCSPLMHWLLTCWFCGHGRMNPICMAVLKVGFKMHPSASHRMRQFCAQTMWQWDNGQISGFKNCGSISGTAAIM